MTRPATPAWQRRVACVLACVVALVCIMPAAASAVGLPFVDIPDATSVAGDAMDAATKSIVGMVADGSAALTNEIIRVSDTVGAPQVGAGNTWFSASYRRVVGVSLWLMAIAALIAIVSAGVRGRIGDVVGVLLVNVPSSVLAMMLVTVGVDLALGLVDAMTAYTFRGSIPQIQQFLHDVGTTFAEADGATSAAGSVLAPGVALVVGLFMILAQLAILAIMVIRSALVYIVTLFLPLVLAVQVWPATRHMTRKSLELLAVLIFSKFAIFTCFALGAGAYTSAGAGTAPPIQSAIVGLGVMAAAAFSPMLLMSIIPGVAGSFMQPGSGGGARGAVGVTSAAQVMRSTLASVHTVRRPYNSRASSTATSSHSARVAGSAALESAHGPGAIAAAAATRGSVAGPAAGAATAAAGAATRIVPPAGGTVTRATSPSNSEPAASPSAPAAARVEHAGPPSSHSQSPVDARPSASSTPVVGSQSMSVPASSQTADGFSKVSTRQPFNLEAT